MVSIVQLLFYTIRIPGQVPATEFQLSPIADTGIALLRSESPAKRKLRTVHPCNGCTTTIREQVPQKYRCSRCCADNIQGHYLRFSNQPLRGFLPPYSFRPLRRRSQRTGYRPPSSQKAGNLGRRNSGNIHSAATFRFHSQAAS